MTTLEAEIKLFRHFDHTKCTMVNGVTNASGLVRFESDMLILTKSRFATCIEIKVSKSDLKNDLKKKHIKSLNSPTMLKNNRYFKPLKYFYYAVPSELIPKVKSQVPAFCGIINLDKMSIVRAPKIINNTKWTAKEEQKLMRLGCLRILNLKQNILNLKTAKPTRKK